MYIQEKGKGVYRVYLSAGTDYKGNRKRISKQFHASTKRELKDLIKDWINELEEVNAVKGSVSDMIDAVWPYVIQNKSPNTVVGYETIRKRINKTIGNVKLDALSPKVIQDWINHLDLSPKTIKNTYSFLRRCCSVAVSWELMKTNPCHDVILPIKEKKEANSLTTDELKIFMSGLDSLDPNSKVMFELALFGSLRRGEIMAIRENDIAEDGKFYVDSARYVIKGQSILKDVKTPSGRRFCILPAFVVEDVKALRKHHIEQRLKSGAMYQNSEFLIKAPDGKALNPNRANDRLHRYMISIGLQPVTFHQLRHTYASMAIALGADVETVSKRMGHANATTTLSIYTHMFNNEEAVADKLASGINDFVASQK